MMPSILQSKVMEPSVGEWVVPQVVVVPLLAFCNNHGKIYRLGYGGGFYDRTLENMRAITIGVGLDGLECPQDEFIIEKTD